MGKATVGELVLYRPLEADLGYAPDLELAAIICEVLDNHMVNLAVFSPLGHPFQRQSVSLGVRALPGEAKWRQA